MSHLFRSRFLLSLPVLLAPGLALAQGVSIDHQGVGCVVAGKFPRFDARLEPAAEVARARVHFRPEGGAHWYSVEMKPEAGVFHGVLPKPQKSLHRFSYYIDVTDKAFHASRTAEFVPEVASGPAACRTKKLLAAALTRANVLLYAPEGVVGVPAVPAGFAADGVVVAGGAGTTAGTTTATAGGSSAKAVILGTVLAAGGAAAVVATSSGGESPSGEPSPPPTTPAGPPPPTTPAPSPSPTTLSGTWVGNGPNDGIRLTFAGCGFCTNPTNQAGDLVMNLSQSGSSISGNTTGTVTEAPPAGCPAEPNCNYGPVGMVSQFPVTGSVNGTSVIMQLLGTAPGQGGTFVLELTGTVAGNRMSGTVTFNATNTPSATGTWAVNRQ